MALVEFGNVSADMRQEANWYGIPALQNFDAFVTAFVPVDATEIFRSPTTVVVQETDANGQIVLVTLTGNLAVFAASEMVVEAAGVRAVLDGSFTFDAAGNVFGTVT